MLKKELLWSTEEEPSVRKLLFYLIFIKIDLHGPLSHHFLSVFILMISYFSFYILVCFIIVPPLEMDRSYYNDDIAKRLRRKRKPE